MTETSATAVNDPLPLADVDLADLDNFTDGVTPGACSTPCVMRTRCTGSRNQRPTPASGR